MHIGERKRNKYVWHMKMFEQRQFGGHFDSQKPKIQLGNKAHRIQHTQIMPKSAVPNCYTKMHLTCTFLRNPSSLYI